jgi:hypothetical protein
MSRKTVEMPLDDLKQAAWFAAAEAFAQGYTLPDEAAHFRNHLEGSGRQYLMARGVHPHIQMRAEACDEGVACVVMYAVRLGKGIELAREVIRLP